MTSPAVVFEVLEQDRPELLRIAESYSPRLTRAVKPKRWWRSHVPVTISGAEPYLSRAKAEIEGWQEEVFLRRAW